MFCLYCGKEIKYKGVGRPPKYCPKCAHIIHKIKERLRIRRKRGLGTSDFFGHRKKDFVKEYDEIQDEFRKRGITRQFT